MTAIVPDPDAPETRAIDADGRLLRGVFAGKLDDSGKLIPGTWQHIGWADPADALTDAREPGPRCRSEIKWDEPGDD